MSKTHILLIQYLPLSVMQRYILILLLCGGIGFAGGFYFAVALQRQIEVLVGAAIVLAVLTWLGSGAELLGLVRDWFKDQREQESIPSLAFNGFWKKKAEVGFPQGLQQYFIKVSREGGEGETEGVTGHVGITNKLELKEGAWLGGGDEYVVRKVNIITNKYLVLFSTSEYKGKTLIGFYGTVYDPNKPDYEAQLEKSSYENYKKDTLIVKIYASRGRIKKNHMEKGIEDIINEARPIPP